MKLDETRSQHRLEEDAQDPTSPHDFGKAIIPKMVECDRVFAYPFTGYWVDVARSRRTGKPVLSCLPINLRSTYTLPTG